MKRYFLDKLNIQIFAEAGEPSGGGGEPTPPPQADPTPGEGGDIQVPEYISTYVSGVEDEGQKEYLQGLLKDEKAVNLLKGFIKDPNKEWDIKTDDFKDLPDDVGKFLEDAKKVGFSEDQARTALERRREYIAREREAMSPELKQYDENIANFMATEKDPGIQGVYARLAESATGRKVLVEFMQLKTGGSTTTAGASSHVGGRFSLEDWKERYNKAILSQDQDEKKRLKAEALSQGTEYQEYFKVFFREN